VFSQLVAEWLGLPFEAIRYVQGDTDKVPFGRGTYAARSSMIGGSALRIACDGIIEKTRPVAAMMLSGEASQLAFDNGHFALPGGDKKIPMTAVIKAFFLKGGPFMKFGAGLEASGSWNTDPPNFPNGCHRAEVEIDPQTGLVRIESYVAVDDVGRALNPMICEGQIHGGVAQGIGQALLEHVIYDRETGQLLTGSFMDYGIPRADDMPPFDTELAEYACKTNPIGVKAVGEAGTIGAPAAVMNAVIDALRPLGISDLKMPATPLRVWEAIRKARTA
jgi:carbon-monoxide dehydrogenase large subunit